MRSKKLTLICIICLTLVLITSMLFSACAKEEAPAPTAPEKVVYTWKMACHVPPGDIRYDVLHAGLFVDAIRQRTDGRIEITVYPPNALVKVEDQLDAVGTGLIEMMSGGAGYWGGKVPLGKVEAGMPFWGTYTDVLLFLRSVSF